MTLTSQPLLSSTLFLVASLNQMRVLHTFQPLILLLIALAHI